jgi:hypothetical protein
MAPGMGLDPADAIIYIISQPASKKKVWFSVADRRFRASLRQIITICTKPAGG